MASAPLTVRFEYTVFGSVYPSDSSAGQVDPVRRAAIERAISALPHFGTLESRASEPRYGSATFTPDGNPALHHWTESILQKMSDIDGIANVHIDDTGGA